MLEAIDVYFQSPIELILGDAGQLTNCMLNFLQEMNNSTITSKSSTFNPTVLFGQICKKLVQNVQ